MSSKRPEIVKNKNKTVLKLLPCPTLKDFLPAGQVTTDNDPATKKPKIKTVKEDTEKEKPSCVVQMKDEALDSPALDSDIIESPASPNAEDLDSKLTSADFSPVLIPSVPTVSISRRDPRTAQYRQTLPSSAGPEFVSPPHQHPPPVKAVMDPLKETLAPHVSVHSPAVMPKSILMKPSPASLDTSYGSTTRCMQTSFRCNFNNE